LLHWCFHGRENTPADALSRSYLMAWSEAQFKWLEQMPKLTKEDAKLSKLLIRNTLGTLVWTSLLLKME